METLYFTDSQIVFALKQSESGGKVIDVCSKMDITEITFFN
jgi:putative transposase